LIRLAAKVDALISYARDLERQRDALAARAPRLEVVGQSAGEPADVVGRRRSALVNSQGDTRDGEDVRQLPADRLGRRLHDGAR
jgi:hypothetical protein